MQRAPTELRGTPGGGAWGGALEIVLEKIDRKHFLVYIKVKEKLFDIEMCVLERFLKLLKLRCLNRKSPFFIST